MRRNGLKIALLFLSIVTVAAVLAVTVRPDNPVDMRIVNASEVGPTKDVTVEFRRSNPAARFSEDDLTVQNRVHGRWQPPERFPELEYPYLLARTNCERLVFTVPRQTDACRFLLGYRVGPRPYCQAYFFLERHGLSKKFPKFSHTVLKCFPQQPTLRHVQCELKV